MAGYTASPLRRLCLEHGAALATSELLVASCLARRERATLDLATWHAVAEPPGSGRGPAPPPPRAAQIYGVRAADVEAAARLLVAERGVRVVCANFGCPVRKITSRGGGSALPARPKLFASLVRACVRGAAAGSAAAAARADAPPPAAVTTVKLRIGLSSAQAPVTCLEAGAIAAAEGAAAVALHCRTAAQAYNPPVDWGAAARLVERLSRASGGGSGRDAVPVVVNGDVCTGAQALEALGRTGAQGVMVGRGALGRPWAFRGIRRALLSGSSGDGEEEDEEPTLGEALAVALRHAKLWAEHERWLDGGGGGGGGDGAGGKTTRTGGEARAMRQMRSLWPLYTLGHDDAVRRPLLARLVSCERVADAAAAVAAASAASASSPLFGARPAAWAATAPRLKTGPHGAVQRVALPADWLAPERRDDEAAPAYVKDDAVEG
jgi:tRNA-dihydrouridine synthase